VAVDAETTKSWPFDESKELNRENVEALLSGLCHMASSRLLVLVKA
jgi:hypothetical protein